VSLLPAAGRWDDPDAGVDRDATITHLVESIVLASLRPLTREEISVQAQAMVDEAWAILGATEIGTVFERWPTAEIVRTRSGFAPREAPETLRESFKRLPEARAAADHLADADPPRPSRKRRATET
jgi:hypothetical protein